MSEDFPGRGKVAVLRTRSETVLEDYARLMNLAGFEEALPKEKETILKINISWQTWYPACSTAPWQLEGVIRALQDAGYENLIAGHNDTVVVDAHVGERNNKHKYVTDKYGLRTAHLFEPQHNWVRYEPPEPFLVLDDVYPEGVYIPELLIGRNIIQLPTVKCVHPDTEVFLEDGTLTRIGDLVEERLQSGGIPIFDEDGDLQMQAKEGLFSLNAEGRIFSQPTALFWRTPVNEHKLWRVKTKTGREVTVSAEHPFRTPTGWRKASKLQIGDRIAIPRHVKVEGRSQPLPELTSPNVAQVDLGQIDFQDGRKFSAKVQKRMMAEYLAGEEVKQIAADHNASMTSVKRFRRNADIPPRLQRNWQVTAPEKTSPEFWRWMGYFMAEGHLDEKSYFRFVNSDPAIQHDYANLTQELFNIEVQFRRGKDAQFRSDQLREFFEALELPVPLRAGNKQVPRLLFRCPNSEIIAFLEGYFDGDAGVAKTWQRESYHLDVVSKSERLIQDVQCLLQRIGVVGFVRSVRSKATNTPMEKQTYHSLSITSRDLTRLARQIQLRSSEKQERLDRSLEGKRDTNWDTIPIPRDLFREVRTGLGLSQQAVAQGGSQSAISFVENGHRLPSRPMAKKWLNFLARNDQQKQFQDELDRMLSLTAKDIAWDHVVAVEEIEPDTPYLYDFTMEGAPNFVGNGIFLHNTHVFTTVTGAVKNAFGGILGRKRHWTHGVIHRTLVDLLTIQQDIHPGLFAVMDGTFAGDGPGPRAMRWHEKDVILASADQVAIDAMSAHMQGFDPLSIPFIRIAHEKGLGVGDPEQIEIVGEDRDWVMSQDWEFVQEDTFASRGQKAIYHGSLKAFEGLLLRSPLVPWSYFASNFYHNVYWYPFVGRERVEEALETKWGKLFAEYGAEAGLRGAVMPGIERKTAITAIVGLGLSAAIVGAGLWWLRRRCS